MKEKQLILKTIAAKYEEYFKEYSYWHDSLLRPWRKIYLYEHLFRIYSRCLNATYNKDLKETIYDFSSDINDAIKYIKQVKDNACKDYERLQREIDNFGYDRDVNRERIMYKKILEECDELLKLIKPIL